MFYEDYRDEKYDYKYDKESELSDLVLEFLA